MGLSLAASVLEKFPKKRVLILERGILPAGASTKNAGFCCCGGPTDFINDIETIGLKSAIDLFNNRYTGLEKLKTRLGSENIDYE